jgi:alkanesulfonate monooxygenase SsuD/methylene tetrahydromethanopterin reductase-like flavin-dependent oxidoreductase (luciferase family)
MELYRSTLAEHGHEPPGQAPMFKEMAVADTRDHAIETARPYLEKKYRSYAQWGLDRPMGKDESLSVPFEELLKDRFIVGTPEECSEEIERYRDLLGVNHLLLRLQWPGMPQRDVLREIELIGEKVIPSWRK